MIVWSDDEAWRIAEAADAWMRSNRPAGHVHTREELHTIADLAVQRSVAGEAKDMEGWQRAHLALVRLCVDSYRNMVRRRAGLPVASRERPRGARKG